MNNSLKNLKKFQKGHDPRRNYHGRPPKFLSTLKAQGWRNSELNDCLRVMLALTESELKSVKDDEEITAIEKIIAEALLKSMEKGKLNFLWMILDRLLGKPGVQK